LRGESKLYFSILLVFTAIATRLCSAGEAVSLEKFFSNKKCVNQVRELLSKWHVTSQWQQDFQSSSAKSVIKTPTEKIGTWVLLTKTSAPDLIIADRYSPNTHLAVTWNQKSCEQNLSEISVNKTNDSRANSTSFDDKEFQNLVESKRDGIIYAFSDSMHLSVQGISIIMEVAKELHIDLTVLSQAPSKTTTARVLASQDLEFRGMANHFPNLIAYSKNGKISGIYPGLKSKANYIRFVREFLK
jgi:hypothetical protein